MWHLALVYNASCGQWRPSGSPAVLIWSIRCVLSVHLSLPFRHTCVNLGSSLFTFGVGIATCQGTQRQHFLAFLFPTYLKFKQIQTVWAQNYHQKAANISIKSLDSPKTIQKHAISKLNQLKFTVYPSFPHLSPSWLFPRLSHWKRIWGCSSSARPTCATATWKCPFGRNAPWWRWSSTWIGKAWTPQIPQRIGG